MFVDTFFKMEEEHRLFDLKESDLPIWDILRYDIYYKYYFPEINRSHSQLSRRRLVDYLKILLDFIYTVLYFLFNNSENLILPCSRYKDDANRYFDRASYNIIQSLPSKFILETQSIYLTYLYKSATNYLTVIKPVYNKKHVVSQNTLTIVFKALRSTLGEVKVDEQFINRIYTDYLIEYKYYSFLFKVKSMFKKVYFVQNGTQKGLIAAAKKRGISVIELQHGSFEKDHLGYSYPYSVDYSSNILMPDYLFRLGPYWGQKMNIPIQNIITSGNDFFVNNETECSEEIVLIVSSIIHQHELLPLAIQLASIFPHKEIVYKLHFNEYSTKENSLSYFKNTSNVKVICSESSVSTLIAKSEFVIAINSSALYEAISIHKKVFIYQKANFEALLPLLGFSNVIFFSDLAQIMPFVNENSIIDNNVNFFQKFNDNVTF